MKEIEKNRSENVCDMKTDLRGIPMWRKYSLSIQEAAQYYGIGERRLRRIAGENPNADFILEVGSHVRIKRVLFERFLDLSNTI